MTPPARSTASRAGWFELSEDGWRRQNRARPLGALVREALQNAFDHRAGRVEVKLGETSLSIEDDAPSGLARDEYAFQVFLGEKDTPPTWRGRKGRGLKELIASADEARVETVGRTILFEDEGRRVEPNERKRGTRIDLVRRTSVREREEAVRLLRLIIVPPDTELFVDGREVRQPRHFRSLDGSLETVEIRRSMESAVDRATRVDLYQPRPGETPHLFEMGLPVEPIKLPWHADVQQRIPLAAERDAARDPYKGVLAAAVFEALAPELDRKSLEGGWVMDVLAHYSVSPAAIEAWARKMLPRRGVLSSGARADDEARQLGATVVDLRGMPRSAVDQIAAIVETADAFVARVRGPPEDRIVEPGPAAEQFIAFARYLAREVAGRDIGVLFFERDTPAGTPQVDAEFDRGERTLRVNMKGRARLDDPLDPTTLAIILHELAHDASGEHDVTFMRRFEALAGRALRRFADRSAELAPFRRR